MTDMNEALKKLRREYQYTTLNLSETENPIVHCQLWLEQAIETQVPDPTAFVLATANTGAKPSVRVVLLKGIENQKLIFYSHYDSHKGIEMAQNPQVAVDFFWPLLERQIIIQGTVSRISSAESDTYFELRPRESQLAASISHQSQPIDSREVLIHEYEVLAAQLQGKPVKRPENWGGYAISADYFEFWQGRENRLHDRIAYTLTPTGWNVKRLSP